MIQRAELTTLLEAIQLGDDAAEDQLFTRAYDELKRLARQQLRRVNNSGVNPTTLVNEAYLKWGAGSGGGDVVKSAHFYNLMAKAMRHVLLDTCRRHTAQKREGMMSPLSLDESIADQSFDVEQFHALEQALERLQKLDGELAQLLEWHCYAGLSFEQIAELRNVSVRTVYRHWEMAGMLLKRELG